MNPILSYRESKGISRDQFAEILGVSYETVRRWEKGLRIPRDKIFDIAEATNGQVTANDFYGMGSSDV